MPTVSSVLSNSASVPRTVNRGANPFAAQVKLQNNALTPTTPGSIYETVQKRGDEIFNHPLVTKALAEAAKRLGKNVYKKEHYGELAWVTYNLIDLNVDIQRDADPVHIAEDIIARYDPRIAMPVMCTKLKNGRYSAWEGQQTSLAFYVLYKAGLIEENTPIQVKFFDENLVVPGTNLVGEAVANLGFRLINGCGRKGCDAYHLHRSRVNGVRVYSSVFREDTQSEEIQCILEKNNMFPAKTSDAARNQATPGMVSYIHGINTIACHDSDKKVFDVAKKDLGWALSWHNKYYSSEKGVDGGFILAFGRLAAAARLNKPQIVLDAAVDADLHKLFRSNYGSPKGFHKECKARLGDFQVRNNLSKSWRDECLTPILISDYVNWGGKLNLPAVSGLTTYAGI